MPFAAMQIAFSVQGIYHLHFHLSLLRSLGCRTYLFTTSIYILTFKRQILPRWVAGNIHMYYFFKKDQITILTTGLPIGQLVLNDPNKWGKSSADAEVIFFRLPTPFSIEILLTEQLIINDHVAGDNDTWNRPIGGLCLTPSLPLSPGILPMGH